MFTASVLRVWYQYQGQSWAALHFNLESTTNTQSTTQGDEVLFLPPIVEAAESSPAAAAGCARMIRKYLGKDYFARPAWQYNAIMLLRILTENPGPMFTRNFDQKFADVCKGLLRGTKDLNVKQMLMETLDDFEGTKSYDENLSILLQMWTKEKGKVMKAYGVSLFQKLCDHLTNTDFVTEPNASTETIYRTEFPSSPTTASATKLLFKAP